MKTLWQPLCPGASGETRIVGEPLITLPAEFSTLVDGTSDGVWFTYFASLVSFPQPVDLLSDFLSRRPLPVAALAADVPFFSTTVATPAARYWRHTLLWCPHNVWPTVRDFLNSCVVVDTMTASGVRDAKSTYKAALLPVTIADQLALAKRPVLPDRPEECQVEIQFLCLANATEIIAVRPPKDWWGPSIVERMPYGNRTQVPR